MKKFMAIVLTLVMVFGLLPLIGAQASTETLKWSPVFGRVFGTPANFVGGQGSEQYGIQLADTSSSTFSVENAIHVRASVGGWKPIIIQTGDDVGGTEHWASAGFTADEPESYVLTFRARVASGTGQVRWTGGGTTPADEALNTDFKLVTIPFTTTSTSGNITLDTGNTTTGVDFIIKDISIALAASPGTPVWVAGSGGVIGGALGSIQGGGEYAGNWGIQLGDTGTSTMSIVGNLLVTATSGGHKAIQIQTSSAAPGAVGGYSTDAFAAVADKEYKVTFDARVSTGTGQVRIRGNSATNTVWSDEALTTAPKSVSYTYTQTATGGRIEIDTGSTGVGTDVIITNLKIYEVAAAGGTDPDPDPDPDPDADVIPCIELGPRTATQVAGFNQWSAIASFSIAGLDLKDYKKLTWDIDAFATAAGGDTHGVAIPKPDAWGLLNAFIFANGSDWGGPDKVAEFAGGNLLRVVPGERDLTAAMIAGDYSDEDSVIVVQAGNGNAGNFGTGGGGATGAKGQMTRVVIKSLKLVADCTGDCPTCSSAAPAVIETVVKDLGDGKVGIIADADKIEDYITAAKASEVVVLDIADAKDTPKGTTTVVIPFEMLEAFVEEGLSVRVVMPEGTIDISAGILENILKKGTGANKDVVFTVYEVDPEEELNDEQLEALPENTAVFKITLFIGGVQIIDADGEGGFIIYLPWEGTFPVKVSWLDDDGKLHPRDGARQVAGTKMLRFATPRLSFYVVQFDPAGETTDKTGVVMFFGVAGVLLAASGTGTILTIRKLRKK